MLVLTRKLQEKIRIGDEITITVLRTKGKSVRLGIEAPTNISVIRGELSFDADHSREPAAKAAEVSESSVGIIDCSRSDSQTVCDKSRWPAERSETTTTTLPTGTPPAQVHFDRVPRRKLAGLISETPATGGGPLRAMLDRRAATA